MEVVLTAHKIRNILRWVHLILGLEILCYVYSPFSQNFYFRLFTKWIVVPMVVLSGIWIWKFAQINKMLKIK